ncbi:MAG: lipopolysaccharide biosynthesis protein [Saprospiraceae bacterium]|nr:lipopolysaccharide biosynthesis protein [Saprospiraceae bacterium]
MVTGMGTATGITKMMQENQSGERKRPDWLRVLGALSDSLKKRLGLLPEIVGLYLWDVSGRLGAQIISLVVSIIVARYLGPADYGLVSLCLIVISFMDVFANSGLGAALIQHPSPTTRHYDAALAANLLFGVFFTVLTWLSAPWVSWLAGDDRMTLILRVLSFSIIITSFRVVHEASLIKNLAFSTLNKAKIAATTLGGLIGATMAVNGYGVWSLVFQVLSHRLLFTLLLRTNTSIKPVFHLSLKPLHALWRYGLYMFSANFINHIFDHLDAIIIAKIYSPVEVGLFNRAKSLNRLVMKYGADSLGAVTFPSLAKIQDQKKAFVALGLKTEKMTAFITFGLLGGLYVCAESLILILLGEKWSESIRYFEILCLSGFALPLGAACGSMLKASGDSKAVFHLELIKKSILLAGLWIGFYFGLKGYLYSLIVTGVLSVFITFYFVKKSIGVPLTSLMSAPLKYACMAFLAVGCMYWLHFSFDNLWWKLGINSLTFSILYLGMYGIAMQIGSTRTSE